MVPLHSRSWRSRTLLPWAALALALIGAVAWGAHAVALQLGLQRTGELARHRLDVTAARLDGELARFDYLPALLETSSEVFQLLAAPADHALRAQVSRTLHALDAIAGADILYVIDTAGTVVASADWQQPGTPFGQDLSWRPYVHDALARGEGQFYGVGVTSGRAGYYRSFALPRHGRAQGVAAVKIDLEATEREWPRLPGELLVVDERGVVILASRAAWKFRPLQPLTAEARAEAAQARRYGSADLNPLAWQARQPVSDGVTRVQVEGTAYLASERPINHGRWRLLLLDTEAAAQASARNTALSAALAAAVLLLLAVVAWQARREIRQQRATRAALQAAHDSLDQMVQARTAELRAAQADLVHAGKLAALGQMSAGVVHELNQPLAALHTLSDNAAVLLDHQRLPEARANLVRISHLVERLGRITYQLKAFAHKTIEPPAPVTVHKVIGDALFGLTPRLREADIAVTVAVEPPELKAMADAMRLEQVLVNLLTNAVDALAGTPAPAITLRARREGDQVVLVLGNNGPAITPEVLSRLFEPFVTTKPVGKGLGLGLVLSARLVQGFGGRLHGGNLAPSGVAFTIELPAVPERPERPEPT